MGHSVAAAIFDLDGVITRTAQLHAAAWKALFDDFLQRHAPPGQALRPFDAQEDYLAYVDGKPRREGIRSFLASRGIEANEQAQEELAQAKNALFERRLEEEGVATFASTLDLIKSMRVAGVKTAVVSSSRHGREILRSAGIEALFDAQLDGNDIAERGLRGKPEPDMFLEAARQLGSAPGRAIVFEDALAGVRAGRRGCFGLVVGVDRGGNAQALEDAGADLVVADLGQLDLARLEAGFEARKQARAWRVEEEGFERVRESQMESLFAVGNGYLGVRGALDTPPPGAQPDLFVAGVFDRKSDGLPYSELKFLAPQRGGYPYTELVPLPFPLRLGVWVDGQPLDFTQPHGEALRRTLDLRAAVLHIEAVGESAGGRRTVLRTRRCASLADPHLLLQEAVALRENHEAELVLRASLAEPELAARHPHLQCIEHFVEGELELVRYRTGASGIEICIASRAQRSAGVLRRRVSVFTSRDGVDPRAAGLAHLDSLDAVSFEALFEQHAREWAAFWDKADIRLAGLPAYTQALRFGSYHLRLPAGSDPRVSIGARTLTGRAYEGHVFWDTEVFMFPFFLHTEPERARTLLLYRHHTLEGARRRARELGFQGACFAWESTVTGDDVTPTRIVIPSSGKEIPIFTGTQQVHVTADIAYGAWRYWEATQDEDFLAGPGAQLLFETARFWVSRVTADGAGRHHIRGVVGPDEYHHGVDDNAYTNWMARFNLERAAWVAQRVGLHGEEAQGWTQLAASLVCPAPGPDGVIEQFEGFFGLTDHPLPQEDRFKAPVSRLFDWEALNRLKLIKQADVLMLPLLFPEAFSDEVVAANYRYYEPLTDHGSSLSPAVHAAIAARIGRFEDAHRYWKQALWLDLSNAMDNSMLGVHPASMGGAWQALVFGLLGVRFGPDGPFAAPWAPGRLPPQGRGAELVLAWRGRSYRLKVGLP